MAAREPRIQHGETVKCDECNRARPIESERVEMFGYAVGYGPAGETDMFIERDGKVTCYWCEDLDERGDGE